MEDGPFRYHLELSPEQLKITHTALRSLLDDFGHDEAEIHTLIHAILAKLPDEHAIRAIKLEGGKGGEILALEALEPEVEPEGEPEDPIDPISA